MNYDDPERRQAEGWATQPAPPYGGTPAAAESVWRTYWQLERQRRFPKWGWLVVAALGVGMLFLVGIGVRDLHQYRSGAPAEASIVKCQSIPRSNQSNCTVRWYEDGRAHTGQLHRVDGHPLVGSRMDVRVKGDDAYAATSGRGDLIAGSIGVGVGLVLFAYFLVDRRRKRQRALRGAR